MTMEIDDLRRRIQFDTAASETVRSEMVEAMVVMAAADEKTKRIRFTLAVILVLAAAAITVFAPSGRETMSYWIGAALVITAAGCVGFKRLSAVAPKFSFKVDSDRGK